MKMKIPIVDPSNIFSSQESSAGYLSSDNSETGQQEEVESNPLYGGVTPTASDDFSEYLWMENEEEFDKQILQQLEEEALMEHCLEVMMQHEEESLEGPACRSRIDEVYQQLQNGSDLCRQMSNMRVQDKEEIAKQSTLNPNAAEFVPQTRTSITEKSS